MQKSLNKKRLAIVVSGGNLDIPKGLVNAALNRIKHLKEIAEYQIDAFYFYQKRLPLSLSSILYSLKKEIREVNGVSLRLIKYIEFYSDKKYIRILARLLNKARGVNLGDIFLCSKSAGRFKKYDALSVHSNDGAFMALEAKRKYGVPYFVTWHGSDIHSTPFEIEEIKLPTIEAIEEAECNFFVSNALKEASDKLTQKSRKDVLYNAASDIFIRFPDEERKELRRKFGVEKTKVVTFAGTIREIKNALLLPAIFEEVSKQYSGDVVLWVIGNGSQQEELKKQLSDRNLQFRFWGFKPTEAMPELLNCTDVFVIPSKNEGFCLAAVEALRCGANAVGSKVGGIPEVIGEKFCIQFGENFEERFALRVVSLLETPEKQVVNDCFDWRATARKEDSFYRGFLGNL